MGDDGPWAVASETSHSCLCKMVAAPGHHNRANAHLIAAAPDLYEALSSFVDAVECDVIQVRPSELDQLLTVLSTGNAALAKARGDDQ